MLVCGSFIGVIVALGAGLYASFARQGEAQKARAVLVVGGLLVVALAVAIGLTLAFAEFPKD